MCAIHDTLFHERVLASRHCCAKQWFMKNKYRVAPDNQNQDATWPRLSASPRKRGWKSSTCKVEELIEIKIAKTVEQIPFLLGPANFNKG